MGFSHSGQARQCDAYIFLCVFLALLAIRFRFSSPNALESWIQSLSRLFVRFLCCEVPVTAGARSRCLCCASPSWRSLALEAVPADWARHGIDGYARDQEKWQAFCPTDWPTRTEEAEKFGDFVFVIPPPPKQGNHCFFSWRAALLQFCSVFLFSRLDDSGSLDNGRGLCRAPVG